MWNINSKLILLTCYVNKELNLAPHGYDYYGFALTRTNAGYLFCRPATSLRQSIRERRPKPTKDDHAESTVHVDIEPIGLDGMTVMLYDCAGQVRHLALR